MSFAIFPFHLSKVLRLPWKSDARSYEVLHLSRKIISANLKTRCTIPCACQAKQHLNVQKWREHVAFTSKCASRHDGVHFLNISTSKSGPSMVCYVHFDFEKCFAPRHATTACAFSTSQLPQALRTWGAFSFFTCKCASRHNGVHFFDIATSKNGP
jgi:hypothetical protein